MKNEMMPNPYNLPNIRTLLTEGFTAAQLRRLCHDSPEFRPVYDQLTEDTSKVEMVDLLLEHAGRQLQLDRLLALVKAQNPARYQAHQPYYDRPQLEAELAKVEQGIAAQENLRGILPDERIEAMLRELREKEAEIQALLAELTQQGEGPHFQATLKGSGAVAQGKGATAAGTRGVAVGGNVSGNIITGSHNNSDDTGSRNP